MIERRWGVHLDHPWAECVREDGAPKRLYIRTPWAFIQVALWPSERSQEYDWKTRRYTDRWRMIVVRPSRNSQTSTRS